MFVPPTSAQRSIGCTASELFEKAKLPPISAYRCCAVVSLNLLAKLCCRGLVAYFGTMLHHTASLCWHWRERPHKLWRRLRLVVFLRSRLHNDSLGCCRVLPEVRRGSPLIQGRSTRTSYFFCFPAPLPMLAAARERPQLKVASRMSELELRT